MEMIKMKRKVLCSILAILIILASVPMTAFAADGEKTITNISLTATRDLVQYTDGYSTEGNDGEWYFWYDLYATQPVITINYKDGTSKTYTYEEIRRYTDIDLFITDNQDSDSQLKVGTNKTTVFLR
jgi:hypothetical protein